MKTIGVRDLQRRIKECVEVSQTEGVVITRNGHPASLVIGVEGSDWEDLVVQSDPIFWRTIRQRRREKSISAREMRRRVLSSSVKSSAKRRRTNESSTTS
ncbi:MAG: type II toxin-antitoxin system prevent-host-death family antitoxin [Kiritimatiellae bacterium]|nr:type II toxin-antitoxin system prevent-host-death family antitoxin [Kiritimatiellia bacterium]